MGTIRKTQAEARPVNEIIQQFHAAMGLVGEGIGSRSHLDRVYSALQAVGRKIPGVRGRVSDPSARQVLDQLGGIVQDRLAQLDQMRARMGDEDRLGLTLGTALTAKMAELSNKNGITTRSQLDAARSFFRTLKTNVESDLNRVGSPQAKETLGQLRDAIGNVLNQLAG